MNCFCLRLLPLHRAGPYCDTLISPYCLSPYCLVQVVSDRFDCDALSHTLTIHLFNSICGLKMFRIRSSSRLAHLVGSRRTFVCTTRPLLQDLPYHLVIGLPALSPTMETGALAEWYVQEGDKFIAGDVRKAWYLSFLCAPVFP